MEQSRFYEALAKLGDFKCVIDKNKLKKTGRRGISQLTCMWNAKHHYCNFIVKGSYPVHNYGYMRRDWDEAGEDTIRVRSNHHITYRNRKRRFNPDNL